MKLTHKSTWRVSFLDMISLIFSFFVLLFSMMDHKKGISDKQSTAEEGPNPVAVPNKPKSYPSPSKEGKPDIGFGPFTDQPPPALNLDYLRVLLKEKVNDAHIFDVLRIRVLRDRLILCLPESIAFNAAKTTLNAKGESVLKALIPFFLTIDNRIAVAGHSDPRPISKTYRSNWTLSLDRAANVKKTLRALGYDAPMLAIGYGDGRFDEDRLLTLDKNYDYGRRVDIIIYPSEQGALR